MVGPRSAVMIESDNLLSAGERRGKGNLSL